MHASKVKAERVERKTEGKEGSGGVSSVVNTKGVMAKTQAE